jgi:hypothetical protein
MSPHFRGGSDFLDLLVSVAVLERSGDLGGGGRGPLVWAEAQGGISAAQIFRRKGRLRCRVCHHLCAALPVVNERPFKWIHPPQ